MTTEEKQEALEKELKRIVNNFHAELSLFGFSTLILAGHKELRFNAISRHNLKRILGKDTRLDSILPIFLEYQMLTAGECEILRFISSRILERYQKEHPMKFKKGQDDDNYM